MTGGRVRIDLMSSVLHGRPGYQGQLSRWVAVQKQFIPRPHVFQHSFSFRAKLPSLTLPSPVHLCLEMRFFIPDNLCDISGTFWLAAFSFPFLASFVDLSVSKFLDSPGCVKVISRCKASFPRFQSHALPEIQQTSAAQPLALGQTQTHCSYCQRFSSYE